jgi:hypothetical protein
MKFAMPMYEGDSIIRPGPEAQNQAPAAGIQGDSTPKMLQRKITPPAAPPKVDIAEIERQARALRAAAVQSALASLWSWVERFFESARRRRVEEYLARSHSVAELEARLRKLERDGDLVRI